MSNVCQFFYAITLDTLDMMIYTLDIHGTYSEQITYGGNHGNSLHEENER